MSEDGVDYKVEEVEVIVKEVFEEELAVKVDRDTGVRDPIASSGISPLDTLMVVGELEERFAYVMTDEEYLGLETVGDMIKIFERVVSGDRE